MGKMFIAGDPVRYRAMLSGAHKLSLTRLDILSFPKITANLAEAE